MVIDKKSSDSETIHLNAERKKVNMLGQLAFGIVHDIRNSLQVLRASSMMLRKHSDDDKLTQYIDAIDIVIENTSQMSERVLSFSNKPTQMLKEVNLVTTVEEALSLSEYMLPPYIQLKFQRPDKPMPVMANEVEILQALLNLLKNAGEAIEEAGREGVVSISLRECFPWIELVISDNGCGMDNDQIKRVFDPLYTTKEDGTGIGLANVSITIESHGGVISASSKLGDGSNFSIMLPKKS